MQPKYQLLCFVLYNVLSFKLLDPTELLWPQAYHNAYSQYSYASDRLPNWSSVQMEAQLQFMGCTGVT
jgi:hypothetical protein